MTAPKRAAHRPPIGTAVKNFDIDTIIKPTPTTGLRYGNWPHPCLFQ